MNIFNKSERNKTISNKYINREISWLAFNDRVLEEAQSKSNPLLERIKFLSISAENLDEFFMVRVAGLYGQVNAGIEDLSQDGLTPGDQLKEVWFKAKVLMDTQQSIWRNLIIELEESGIEVISNNKLNKNDFLWLEKEFLEKFFPVLTPLAIDPAHPFPFIPNRGLGLMIKLKRIADANILNAIVPIPRRLDRFVRLPGAAVRFIRIEKIIEVFLNKLFPGYDLIGRGCFTVIRDSDIEIEDEAEDLVRLFETALKRRKRGSVIRLKIDNDMPKDLVNFLSNELNVKNEVVVSTQGIVALEDTKQLLIKKRSDLYFTPFNARFPERIREFGGDCFAAIKQKDILVHHPFESFDVVVQFLKQAADDPKVLAIKQTLYRTSKDSPIVEALVHAAEKGKSVTALIELKARFDEEANIKWARDLEKAGVHVVFGFIHMKTHAKVSLVIRKDGKDTKSYVHYGTGNYHPVTAKIYTDLSFFTVDKTLCNDTSKLFNYLTGYADPDNFNKLTISPRGMRSKIISMIRNEAENAKNSLPSGIWAKLNSLVDQEVIDELYIASQCGVSIELIIRGICCLRPGINGLSENIKVRSIIGRFLEHSRIICFADGNEIPSDNTKVFISSADWMPRNFDFRVETLIPIDNSTVHEQILNQIMIANLKDNHQAWELQSDGKYIKINSNISEKFSAHEYFMKNPSLSGSGKSSKSNQLRKLALNNN